MPLSRKFPLSLALSVILLLSASALSSQERPAIAAKPSRQELTQRHSPEAYLAQKNHQGVALFVVGDGVERAYVFTPRQPTPKGAPLVFLHHGWLGMNPLNFGGLIDLLVRRGAVVVYPVYQDDRSSPQTVMKQAAQADLAALRALRERYPDLVDESKTVYMGYSIGAAISINLALDPAHYALPPPRGLLLIAPGDAHHVAHDAQGASIYGNVENLPANLPTVLVSGLADTSIGVPTARKLAKRLCHVQQRGLIMFPSDTDGERHIAAGHGSPGAPDGRYDFPDPRAPISATASIPPRAGFEASGSLNLLDYYGYWRLATHMVDIASGKELSVDLFGDNAENRFLGLWPSGKPYASAQIENPC